MIDIPHQWLRQSGTPEEFELSELQRKASAFNLPLEKVIEKFRDRPFGELTAAWRSFVQQMGSSDELWTFRSPDGTFAQKCGCAGFAIVRGGVICDSFVTLRT